MFRTGKKVIIRQDMFSKMQAYKRFTDNQGERKKLKRELKGQIVRALGDEWGSYKVETQAVFDEIIYKATDRGYSFNGIETLVNKCGVSESTVKRVLKRLKSTGLVYVGYRKNPNGKGAKTPVVFFVKHPHFNYWKALLSLPFEPACELACEDEKPSQTKEKEKKTVSTYGLPYKKKDNILNTFEQKGKNIFKNFKRKGNTRVAGLPKWLKSQIGKKEQPKHGLLSMQEQQNLKALFEF